MAIYHYNPININTPLSSTMAPAMACIQRSSFPAWRIFNPLAPRNTMKSMVAMVTNEKMRATSMTPPVLCSAAG